MTPLGVYVDQKSLIFPGLNELTMKEPKKTKNNSQDRTATPWVK